MQWGQLCHTKAFQIKGPKIHLLQLIVSNSPFPLIISIKGATVNCKFLPALIFLVKNQVCMRDTDIYTVKRF